ALVLTLWRGARVEAAFVSFTHVVWWSSFVGYIVAIRCFVCASPLDCWFFILCLCRPVSPGLLLVGSYLCRFSLGLLLVVVIVDLFPGFLVAGLFGGCNPDLCLSLGATVVGGPRLVGPIQIVARSKETLPLMLF
ncbi:hypothetical protein Dimus_029146, partial [Dionaea muscipula]